MNLRLEARDIARIAEQIAPLCDGDEELLHDMMTGETQIDNLVRRLHEQVARDDETLLGIAERKRNLGDRASRIERRRDSFKAGIGKLLRAAHLTKLELPEVTYSVRVGKAGLAVVAPEAVPKRFQRTKAEPDKAKINEHYDTATKLPNWLVREDARDVVSMRTK